jgi:hypothetical protein
VSTDPVSSIDQLVVLLRQRLSERSRAARSATASRPETRGSTPLSVIDRARALAAIEGLDERQLQRAVIQNLLTDHFGAHLMNDAQFQQVVDRVADAITDDEASSRLLAQVMTQLRATPA